MQLGLSCFLIDTETTAYEVFEFKLSSSARNFKMKGLWFKILVVCLAFVEVFSIHCYDCNSFDDPACSDPLKNSTSLLTVDCDTKRHPLDINIAATFCRKIKQRGE